VLDRADAVLDGVPDRLGRVGVGGDVAAAPGRLVGDGTDLLGRVLGDPDRVGERHHPAGGHHLDRVGTAPEPVAGGGPHGVDTVDDLDHVDVAAAHVAVDSACVPVSAGLAEGGAGVEVAGCGDGALGDGPRDAGVSTGDVTDGGEPARQRGLQPPGPGEREVAERGALDGEQVERDAVGVAVRVDQSG
jgi:hypothetical protein